MNIFVESGKKKVLVGAVDWPGWCRFGRQEADAIQVFLAYGNRYAKVLELTELAFQAPVSEKSLKVVEQHPGTASTDFGAPAAVLEADQVPMDPAEYLRARQILQACWTAFD